MDELPPEVAYPRGAHEIADAQGWTADTLMNLVFHWFSDHDPEYEALCEYLEQVAGNEWTGGE